MFKQVVVILSLLFSFSANTIAQEWSFGIRGSLTYCDNFEKRTPPNLAPNFQYLYYTEPRLGMDFSFAAQKLLTDKIGLDASIGYSLTGGNFNEGLGTGAGIKIGSSHYILFSPSFLYKPSKKLNLNMLAGVNVGYLLKSDMVDSGLHEKIDLSWSLGTEYLFQNIGLFVKYQRSFTPFFTQSGLVDYGGPKLSFYSSSFKLGATYYFK